MSQVFSIALDISEVMPQGATSQLRKKWILNIESRTHCNVIVKLVKQGQL